MENKARTPWEKIRSMTDGQLRKLFARFVNLSDEQIGQIIDQVLEPEVKACPFCGGEAVLLRKDTTNSFFTEVYRYCCKNPNCSGNYRTFYATQEDALIRWNRRAGSE